MLISASAFLQIKRYTLGLLGVCHGMQPGWLALSTQLFESNARSASFPRLMLMRCASLRPMPIRVTVLW